ncbi:hypothetical protein [Anaerosporobacter sp.]
MPIDNTQELKVGMNTTLSYKPIMLKQYDKNTRKIEITLVDNNGVISIPSGAYAKLQGTNRIGEPILEDCDIENNKVIYTATENLTSEAGTVQCEIGIYEADSSGDKTKDKLLQSATFPVIIQKSAMDRNAIINSDEFNTLTIMINTITGLVDRAESTIEEINIAISNSNIATNNAIDATNTSNEATTNNTKNVNDAITNMASLVNAAITESDTATQANINIITTTNQTVIENESARISAETTRNTDEIARQTQEANRQTDTTTAITNANAATTRANVAAQAAEDIVSGILELPDVGTPGIYTKVTTDEKGRVASGSNPTAIEDLGITNVYTKTEVDTKLDDKADKTEIPTSLPANGGNADTIDNLHASDFATATHTHKVEQITDFPSTLPANGGNADTVGGKLPSAFAATSHTHTKSNITDFPTSLPANGGNSDTVDNIHISVVTSLPTTKDANTLYLVKG